MTEDLLSHAERLRLECLAQVVALHAMKTTPSAGHIIRMASQFEAYIADPPEAAPQVAKIIDSFGAPGRYITEPMSSEQTEAALDAVHRRLTGRPTNGD